MDEKIVLTLYSFFNWSTSLQLWFTTIKEKFSSTCSFVFWKSEYFKNFFIPNIINEWNKFDLGSSTSYNLFRDTLLKFTWPAQKKTFNSNDSVGINLLTRLGLSNHVSISFRRFLETNYIVIALVVSKPKPQHIIFGVVIFIMQTGLLLWMTWIKLIALHLHWVLSSKFIDLFLCRSDKFLGKNTLLKHPGEMCPCSFLGQWIYLNCFPVPKLCLLGQKLNTFSTPVIKKLYPQ